MPAAGRGTLRLRYHGGAATAQSTVSRHLAYLKNSGWVDDRRCGVWMYYSIVDDGNDMKNCLLDSLRNNINSLETAAADRERLAGFSQHNSCA